MIQLQLLSLALLAILLTAGCAGRAGDQDPPCSNWSTYTLPQNSCLFAEAANGSGLSTEAGDMCLVPVKVEASTVTYNAGDGLTRTVAVYCSQPGDCSVRVEAPETDTDCRDSIGAAVAAARGAQ